jgi:UDP-N-acetylmuramyl pentapeptide phosphotransferase/UDP-N-acetylglucosamine-1-phosphate transferase
LLRNQHFTTVRLLAARTASAATACRNFLRPHGHRARVFMGSGGSTNLTFTTKYPSLSVS